MKKLILLILIIVSTALLTSCKKVDVDKLTTASAIGIDKSENGIKVTVQAINASATLKEGGGNRSSFVVYSEDGKTIYEVLRKLMDYFPSRIFRSHFLLLVFGEEIAREGIEQYILYFYANPETRQKYNIVVVKDGTAEDLLKIQTPFSKNPADEINQAIEANQQLYGVANLIYVDTVLANIRCGWSGVSLTGIKIEGEAKEGSENKNLETSSIKTRVKINGLAAFKNDQLVGWLNEEESRGVHFTKDLMEGTIISLKYNEEFITFEIDQAKTKLKYKRKDNIPNITISTDVSGIIYELKTGTSFVTKDETKEIEEIISEEIKKTIEAAIIRAQELTADFLFISSLIHRKDKNYWKEIKDNYDEIFPQIQFEVQVEAKIKGTNI